MTRPRTPSWVGAIIVGLTFLAIAVGVCGLFVYLFGGYPEP
mgnify:FL=1